MTLVTRYTCSDGSEWRTEEQASLRDKVLNLLDLATQQMPPAEDDACRYANGDGYMQRTAEQIARFTEVLGCAIELEQGVESKATKLFKECPTGFVGRYLDDGDSACYRAYLRLCCIDSQLREWGQPYYALNPDKGKQVEWGGAAS